MIISSEKKYDKGYIYLILYSFERLQKNSKGAWEVTKNNVLISYGLHMIL